MGHVTLRTAPLLASLCLAFLTAPAVRAQYPDSVDIDLRQSTLDANSLEVYVRSNGQPFGDVLSGLTFTIRWVTTSPATLGPRVNSCPVGISISPTPQVTNPLLNDVPTGYNYRSYNAFGTSLLSDEGCPLPQDEWYLVMTVPVENNTGCTEFNIVNDDWTDSPGNARDYFVSLGGFDLTGSIDPESAFIGACALDCLGIIGGSALPGSPCDDGNAGTTNDAYTAGCVCVGDPAADCQGTIGGTALPGTPCDDDNTQTVNDTWTAECVCVGELTTGVPLTTAPSAPAVWPNPTTGLVYISAAQATGPSRVRVSDALGRVLTTPITRAGGASPWLLDLSNAPAGMYLIELESEGVRSVQRVVKR